MKSSFPMIILLLYVGGCGTASHRMTSDDAGDDVNDADVIAGDSDVIEDSDVVEDAGDAARPDGSVVDADGEIDVEGDSGSSDGGVRDVCCPDGLAYDVVNGYCVDIAGSHENCLDDAESCRFGLTCTTVFVGDWGTTDLCVPASEAPCPRGYYRPTRYNSRPGLCSNSHRPCQREVCEPPLRTWPDREVPDDELLPPCSEISTCADVRGLGEDCSEGRSCGARQTCHRWFGERGETQRTCELLCGVGSGLYAGRCPNGFFCVDDPQEPSGVCRPLAPEVMFPFDSTEVCRDPSAIRCGSFEDKLIDFDRSNVCQTCSELVICSEEWFESWEFFGSFINEGRIACSEPLPDGPCRGQVQECRLTFDLARDCESEAPSSRFWNIVCNVVSLSFISSVHCEG